MFIDSAVVVASSAATNLMCQAALSALKHSSALTHTRTGTHTHSNTLTRTCCCEAFISSLFLVLFIVFFLFCCCVFDFMSLPCNASVVVLRTPFNYVELGLAWTLHTRDLLMGLFNVFFFFFFELGVLGALRFLMLMLLFISG